MRSWFFGYFVGCLIGCGILMAFDLLAGIDMSLWFCLGVVMAWASGTATWVLSV